MTGMPVRALLAISVLVGPAFAADDSPTAILGVRHESTETSTRLTVESTGPLVYTYYSPDPLSVVVDLPDVDASKVAPQTAVGTTEVRTVTVTSTTRPDGHTLARLEVKLASAVPYQIFSKDQTLNLVFDRPARVAEAPRPEPTPAPAAAQPIPEPPAPPPAVKEEVASAPTPRPEPVRTARRASRVSGVSQGMENGEVAVTLKADGALQYQDFFVSNPDRLVIDVQEVSVPQRTIDVNRPPVRRARLAQFSPSPRIGRLVLDLTERSPYRIVDGDSGLKVLFGEGRMPAPAPLAALRTEPEVAQSTIAPVAPTLHAPAPATPAAEPVALVVQQTSGSPEVGGSQQQVYTGHPVTLDFKDGDLQDIFRLFSEISGLNIVVNPGISGKVTLKLNEVPWDQALDIILKSNGLGRVTEDNVIRIARLADLQKEEDEIRKLKENKALAGDLTTWRKSLSYAKAADLEPTLKKVSLSPRGVITLDSRTNTMIITDLPARIEDAKILIGELDRQTPQVEIEARIVVTSRNFTRDVGIQWGFLNQQTAQFGNTTKRAFPNSIVLNGQAAGTGLGISADQQGLATAGGIGTGSPRGYAVNLPAASFNSGIGISLGNILGSFNIDAALTALERQGRGRILSTPKVTTQNNQEAEIKQGVQIPIAIQQTTGGASIAATNVQFKDAFLTLKVTPQITEAGTVILKLEVENNSPDFANRVNGIPPINTQSAKTIVLVRDGATTVIGGIYQSNEQMALNATPFFGRLPLIGALFRNRSTTSQNNELLLFITPRIIKG